MDGFDRMAVGVLVSLSVHAALFALIAALFVSPAGSGDFPAQPQDEPPQIVISQVDLSFAEEEDEQPSANAAAPVPAPVQELLPPSPVSHVIEPPPLKVAEGDSSEVPAHPIVEVRESPLRPRDVEAPDFPRDEAPKGGDVPMPSSAAPSAAAASGKVSAEKPSAPSAPSMSAPAPAADKLARARGTVKPTPRGKIPKVYPSSSRKRGEEGDVTLDLSIDAHGVVIGVKVVASCGFEDLEKAALAAARKVMFRPAQQGDEPVPSIARLTWSFKLRD